ncbi:MAG: UvrD-helicase domain-containing protein, partial [Erysipelotrichaceae bacterium]|nr:UvrD-helicase domain-containing protein [Erysipelotrichaceae bacterium]
METLNASQLEAVETTEGYVRVVAGAGSGKTRALSCRFAYLVNELGILPSSILCVTFTNKSAAEMKARIRAMIGDQDAGMVCTFHSFCSTVLLEDSHAIGYPKTFMVLDNTDIDAILGRIYEERGLSLKDMTFSMARDRIEVLKLFEIPDYYQDLISLSAAELLKKYQNAKNSMDIIFYGYLYYQKKSFGLDYNDLIILTLHIFKTREEIREKWQQRLEYIMIDEFQDIDGLQYELMEVLSKWHKNLFVVGDPDQTIYTWRGARIAYLMEFDQNFPDVQTIFMNQNYRSTPQILQVSNALIAANSHRIEKNLYTSLPNGPAVQAAHFASMEAQGKGVAELVESLIKKGYRYKDIAILYRAHYMSRSLEEAFMKKELPYTICSGIQFYQRAEIKDALSYMRMLVYRDDLDFLRTVNTPRRSVGRSRIQFLTDYAQGKEISLYQALKENLENPLFSSTKAGEYIRLIDSFQTEGKPVHEILAEILDRSGYERMRRTEGAQERLDNLAELKQAVLEYEQSAGEDVSLEEYLRHTALACAADQGMETDKVKMMTVHTAKGLEFPVVILPGMSEGIFPSRKTKNLEGMEEERRLAFVAMTRAKERLFLTEAQGVNLQGVLWLPSRFLLEIGEGNLAWNPPCPDELMEQTRKAVDANPRLKGDPGFEILKPGDRVRHKAFGEGTVLECDQTEMTYLVLFDRLNTRRRLSHRAKLEKTGHQAL